MSLKYEDLKVRAEKLGIELMKNLSESRYLLVMHGGEDSFPLESLNAVSAYLTGYEQGAIDNVTF